MKIAILGLGAYGIALAKAFYENDNKVSMWTKYKEEADIVLLKRENINVLPSIKIPKEIEITTQLEKCMEKARIIVLAVPMSAVREVSKEISKYLTCEQVICIVSKGIEQNSNMLMSDVVYEETKSEKICMLSGPSFAMDLVKENEVGLVVASNLTEAQMSIKVCLENERIIINTTRDIRGVQVAAATKNVFAILCGMLDGMKKSESTKAAVLSCLCNDLRIIIEVLGGKPQTIFSYAGIGDLLLTCMSKKSRNYTFGKYIGEGKSIDEALEKMQTKTVEGLYTLDSLKKLLEKIEIKVESIELLYKIIYEGYKVDNILKSIKR